MENRSLDELANAIAVLPSVWVRLVATPTDGYREVRSLEIVAGERPAHWQAVGWHYPAASLVGAKRKGSVVARWLRGSRFRMAGFTFGLPTLADVVTFEHRASDVDEIYERLDWPVDEWRLLPTPSVDSRLPYVTDLLADGCPSFANLWVAAAFLFGIRLRTGGEVMASLVARLQSDEGRIASFDVHPTSVAVTVEGRVLRGCTVEIAGSSPGAAVTLRRAGRYTVRLPLLTEGLTPGSWLVLHRGGGWLDRRFLNEPFVRAGDDQQDAQIDDLTRVQTLVTQGEGPTVEFKLSSPLGAEKDTIRRFMKTVAAFANGDGGSVLVGVQDDGEIVGLSRAESDGRARDGLVGAIRSWLSPLPLFDVRAVRLGRGSGRWVLIVEVSQGATPPYGAGTEPTKLVYYVRRGATTFAIDAREVRELARSRPVIPLQQPSRRW